MDATVDDNQHELVDLSGLSLSDLSRLGGSVVANSVRRILEDVDRPQDAVAGWNSAM
ncbi:FxSxx-COOH cyclophane-containing RiPP peptide [Micromonospora sp. CPCC 206061]|uniref:FxSxx-COOH cyclophane-containing RiPP peptide n=1 Tax=Micromonospora sp. CPCC 206061 TaxID=3122410 RepID=UPI003FA5E94E